MKKLFAMVMAVAAISFVSCGNKTEKAECEDTCACACDTCVCDPCDCAAQACQKECGECPVKALAEKLEAGDAEAVGTALTEAQTKIEALVAEGKTEEAQKLGSAIKAFVEENKAKLADAQITVDNIVSTIAAIPAAAEATAEAGAEAVKADAQAVKEGAEAAANAAVEAGKAKAEETVNQAVEAGKAEANKQIDKGVDAAKKKLGL
ncbi:MAG: hypothetical protein ILA39_04340 [Bacteroidaceae bacterium]|nr:hypothetical protein [Bacteroidaceae bacterium]